MLSTPIVLKSLDSPLPLETATFVIHALYTEFVVGVLGFFQFICVSYTQLKFGLSYYCSIQF